MKATKYTVTKRFSNYKAAHRQWRHAGHCSRIHGENWTFEITLGSDVLNDQRFVLDFGEFKTLRDKLECRFDHTLLVDSDDPALSDLLQLEEKGLTKLTVVPSCGAEGLAKLVYDLTNEWLLNPRHQTPFTIANVHVLRVTVFEDDKNSATYEQP